MGGCASPQWESVVKNRQAKGAYQDGQCAVYAKDLQQKLPFATQRITWTATDNEPIRHTVRHQVLAYQVGKESWFIDSVTALPRWVGSTSDSMEERAKQFYAPYSVRIAAIVVE